MAEARVQRRLAAVLAADVVGYSRLMETDEAGTLVALKARRRDVLDPLVARHQGRIFKTTGDGVLIEFASAVNAVQCAVELQQGMAMANGGQPENWHIVLRIGVNLGDVIVEGSDLYGDGVNVAARLEALAEPGGILVSGTAYDHVRKNVKTDFDDLGPQALKNITDPVRAYRVAGTPTVTVSMQKAGTDKPSIAVLPFANMSGDLEQEYFSDGITEDIITELSRYRELFVIARDSTFQFKGRSKSVTAVAAELGVRYVLQGSVRKAGDRVRITAQLVVAESGQHIWAERYDRNLSDIFAVQDEVVRSIVAVLPAHVEAADLERAKRKTPASLRAYDYLLRAKEHHHRATEEDNARALELLEQAIALEPGYAHAHAWLACVYGQAFTIGFRPPAEPDLGRCIRAAETAYAFDSEDSEAHRILAEVRLQHGRPDEAWHHHDRALALNPNDARIVSQRGEFLTWLGRPAEGIEWIANAIRLDPSGAERRAVYLGRAYFLSGRYWEAIEAFACCGRQTYAVQALKAACYAALGQEEEARAAAAEVLGLRPNFSIETYLATQPYRDPVLRERCAEMIAAAGLPR